MAKTKKRAAQPKARQAKAPAKKQVSKLKAALKPAKAPHEHKPRASRPTDSRAIATLSDAFATKIEPMLQLLATRISPSPAERACEQKLAAALLSKLKGKVDKRAQLIFVGSAARDTGLRGSLDLDLFVAYPRIMTREQIVKDTIDGTKKAIDADWEMHYAEHPYLRTTLMATGPNGGKLVPYDIEVIPCFQTKMGEKVKSAVDRSILHMDYLQKNLTGAQRRDVRCLKAFLKSAGIYGAELEIGGFSGLVCEQLILNYRSFATLVQAAAKWRFPALIDVGGRYANEGDKARALAKFEAPIVLPDVVDDSRNAAAAITMTNAAKFVTLCRAFVAKPDEHFFDMQKREVEPEMARSTSLRLAGERGTAIYLAWLPLPKGVVRDISVPQLRRMEGDLRKQAENREFRVMHSASRGTDEFAFLLFELMGEELPRVQTALGPPVTAGEANVKAFVKQGGFLRGPFISGERVMGEKPREYRTFDALLKESQKNPVKFGIPSYYEKSWRTAKIAKLDEKSVRELPDDLAQELYTWLTKKDEWLL